MLQTRLHFTVSWLTWIFSRIYAIQSVAEQGRGCGCFKLCKRPAGTIQNPRCREQTTTGGAFAQIALRRQQKVNHSAAMNFSVGSFCWMLSLTPTPTEPLCVLLSISFYSSLGQTCAGDLLPDHEDTIKVCLSPNIMFWPTKK